MSDSDTDRTSEPMCESASKQHDWIQTHNVEQDENGSKDRDTCSVCNVERITLSWTETRTRTRTIYVPGLVLFGKEHDRPDTIQSQPRATTGRPRTTP